LESHGEADSGDGYICPAAKDSVSRGIPQHNVHRVGPWVSVLLIITSAERNNDGMQFGVVMVSIFITRMSAPSMLAATVALIIYSSSTKQCVATIHVG
jgi:hypothetical protein